MRNRTSLILFFLFVTVFPECISGKVVAGAGRFEQYLPFIQGKRVGMVVHMILYGRNCVPEFFA